MSFSVTSVEGLDLRYEPMRWAFADERRAEIDAYFAEAQRIQPQLWNGRVLLLSGFELAPAVLRGTFFETDYASMLAWLRWGCPAAGAWDCFGAAAVLSAEGAFLLGQMGAHTANAGSVYFPCGTPEAGDTERSRVDFDRSVARELAEETGLRASEFRQEPGWTIVHGPARIVAFKVMRSSDTAAALRSRVEAHLAAEAEPELAAVRMVGGRSDLSPDMPAYVTTFLASQWQTGDQR